MCEYCKNDKTMMVLDVIDRSNWAWGYDDEIKLTLREAESDPNKVGIFVDRGHLRMVELNDSDCMESGQNIKINYCPMCGEKIDS